MNLGKIKRTISRHRHMHDTIAYRSLLEHARAHGDVWMVPQRDIAAWWADRNRSRIQFEPNSNDTLTLSCSLAKATLELDAKALHPFPFQIDFPGRSLQDLVLPYPATGRLAQFVRELLAHLGSAHLALTDIAEPAPQLMVCVQSLHEHALQHQRYEPELLAEFREYVAEAHHQVGLPELRIWNWPSRDHRPYRMALSVRYDVDKAIVSMPAIHALEEQFSLRSTSYLRPAGLFYGRSEITAFKRRANDHELALHGEFVSTSERLGCDELRAAQYEKSRLQEFIGSEVHGVCMHGGELRSNTTSETRNVVEEAGFRYDTLFRNRYYLPLYIPMGERIRRTLSIGQHFADITVPHNAPFVETLSEEFERHFEAANRCGGVFVPVMHPLYFGIWNYLKHPVNAWRILSFAPQYLVTTARMKKDQEYVNR